MKKILIAGMVIIFAFTLSACGKKQTTTTQQGAEQQTPQEVTLVYTIKNRNNTYSLYSNGEVYAKGTNKCGELGLGHKVEMPNEVKIEGLTGIQKIVLQQNEDRGAAYFINALGEVYVTGYNAYGQLGLGHTNDVIVPTKVEGLIGIADIAVSEAEHCNTYFINQNGAVYVAGANINGELGLGHKNQVNTPEKIEALDNKVIKKIIYAEGFRYTVFLNDRGEVFVSGSPEIVNQKVEEPIVEETTVEQQPNNSIFGFTLPGGEQKQETELNSAAKVVEEKKEDTPKVNDPTIPTKIAALNGIKIIDIIPEGDSRQFKIYYIAENGEVYATGYNRGGVLGINTEFNKVDDKKNEYISVVIPQKVTALNGVQIKGRVDEKFIGMNDEKYQIISGEKPRAKQVK